MDTVYVVATFWYEGTDINGIYSNRDAAEKHQAAIDAAIKSGSEAKTAIKNFVVLDEFDGDSDQCLDL
jgi:thioredoxin reductase